MKLANVDGRAVIITEGTSGVDIANFSGERYGPDLQGIYEQWNEFTEWARTADFSSADAVEFGQDQLRAPSPKPTQIIAFGLNYSEHAAESGFEQPDQLPPVFTKFASSLTGPYGEVKLPPGGNTDWEVELAVVIGTEASQVPEENAWDVVAGLMASQDLSERVSQLRGPAPQFSLGKSFPGFLPTGPWLTTLDELEDPDDIGLRCAIDGDTVQDSSTAQLIFSVPQLIAGVSEILTLQPGDILLTGTPAGVGVGRRPQRFLKTGETLTTEIDGLGTLRQTFV